VARYWAFSLLNPQIEPLDAADVLRVAVQVRDVETGESDVPWPLEVTYEQLSGEVGTSRARFDIFFGGIWNDLAEESRTAFASLLVGGGRAPSPRGADFARLPQGAILDFLQTFDTRSSGPREDARPTTGDLRAWGHRVNDGKERDAMRALLSWAVRNYQLPAGDPAVLTGGQEFGFLGPGTAGLTALISRVSELTALEWDCLTALYPPGPLANRPDRKAAWPAVHRMMFRRQLGWVWSALDGDLVMPSVSRGTVAIDDKAAAVMGETLGLDVRTTRLLARPFDAALEIASGLRGRGETSLTTRTSAVLAQWDGTSDGLEGIVQRLT
jgi:hypothetical protein